MARCVSYLACYNISINRLLIERLLEAERSDPVHGSG